MPLARVRWRLIRQWWTLEDVLAHVLLQNKSVFRKCFSDLLFVLLHTQRFYMSIFISPLVPIFPVFFLLISLTHLLRSESNPEVCQLQVTTAVERECLPTATEPVEILSSRNHTQTVWKVSQCGCGH